MRLTDVSPLSEYSSNPPELLKLHPAGVYVPLSKMTPPSLPNPMSFPVDNIGYTHTHSVASTFTPKPGKPTTKSKDKPRNGNGSQIWSINFHPLIFSLIWCLLVSSSSCHPSSEYTKFAENSGRSRWSFLHAFYTAHEHLLPYHSSTGVYRRFTSPPHLP